MDWAAFVQSSPPHGAHVCANNIRVSVSTFWRICRRGFRVFAVSVRKTRLVGHFFCCNFPCVVFLVVWRFGGLFLRVPLQASRHKASTSSTNSLFNTPCRSCFDFSVRTLLHRLFPQSWPRSGPKAQVGIRCLLIGSGPGRMIMLVEFIRMSPAYVRSCTIFKIK